MSRPSAQSQSLFSLSSLVTEAGTVLSARIAGAGLSYVVQVLFARWAGPDHYGVYSYVMAWTVLLTTFSGLGFPHAIVRFIPEYQSNNNWDHFRGVIQRSEHVVASVSCALALLGSLTVIGFPSVLGSSSTYVVPMVIGFIFIPPRALLKLQTKMCVARQQMRIAYMLPQLLRPTSMIVGATALVFLLNASLTATQAVLITGGPVLLVWLIQRWIFRQHLPGDFEQATPVYESSHWLRIALPMFLISGFILLLNNTDLLMIGLLAEAEQVGLYKVATKTASLALFPVSAVTTVVMPRVATYYTNQNHEQLQHLASRATKWMLGGSLIVALGILLSSELILETFGPSFLRARTALLILTVGQLFNAATGPLGALLTMTGNQTQSAKVYGICAILNGVLNAIGISFFGIEGAALATVLSTVLWNVGLYGLVVSNLGIRPSIFGTTHSDAPST